MKQKFLLRKAVAMFFACCGGLGLTEVNAQYTNPVYTAFSAKIVPNTGQQVMVFTPSSKVTLTSFVNTFNSSITTLGSSNSALKLLKSEMDSRAIQHNIYIQNIGGVEVENALVKTHVKSSFITSAAVFTSTVPVTDITPTVSSVQAEANALASMGTGAVRFTSTRIKKQAPKLIITKDKTGQYVLAWKTDVFTKTPVKGRQYVYINAKTGSVIKKESRSHNCGNPTVQTRYDGLKQVNTNTPPAEIQRPDLDVLLDDCHAASCGGSVRDSVETVFFDEAAGDFKYYSKLKTSNWSSDLHHQIGFQVHWGLGKVYDYYKCVHGRASYDNQDTKMVGVTHWNYFNNQLDPANAAWYGDGAMMFGDGGDVYANTGTRGAVVSLDITGHEIAHGVTEHSAALVYGGESGALNEAWSDIFGTEVEFYAKAATANFNIGEDVWTSGYLRSMSNPNSRNQPDTYGGLYWFNTAGCDPETGADRCGVHVNSGVANYWYYLLSMGGSGTNDLGNSFSVTGITRAKAAAIAYRALVYHFTPTTNFAQARAFTILAADELYGPCSNEAIQVAKAWYAVGVGANPVNTITGPASVCPYQTNVTFAITAHTGSTYTWTLPPNVNVVSGAGTNSIKLNFNGTTPGTRTISVNEITTDVCVPVSKTFTVLDAVANPTACNAYPKPLSPNALQFDGNDVVMLPAHSKNALGNGDFTIELMVKSNPNLVSDAAWKSEALIMNNNDNSSDYINFYTNRSNTATGTDGITFNSGSTNVSTGFNLKDNKCHHLAVVKNSVDARIYIDGVLYATQPNIDWKTTSTGNSTQPWTIGSQNELFQNYTNFNSGFQGSIKEVRIWKTARTQTQIQTNMSRALYGNEPYLVAYYPMDEGGTTETVYDRVTPTASLVLNNGMRGNSLTTTDFNPLAISNSCTTTNTRIDAISADEVMADELSEKGISAYPNPFTSELSFSADFGGTSTYSVELINSLGAVVYSSKDLASGKTYTITDELTPGYYILKCNDGHSIKTRNIVKK
jgi:Zn-dependent metalloprotease